MSSYLADLIRQVEVLNVEEIAGQILVAAALGFVIYLPIFWPMREPCTAANSMSVW